MELIIKDKIQNKLKNCFVINHTYEIGDADGFYNFKNIISKDNPFLIKYIKVLNNFLNSTKDIDAHDISFTDFDNFYFSLDKSIENYYLFWNEIGFEQHSWSEAGWHSYEGYSITYFDENGDEFEVEIKE